MDKSRDLTYCKHILELIAEIETFVLGMTFQQFEADLKTQRAVTRDLEVIGEASKRLSEEFQDRHGKIPWRRIGGMRDFLIHDYMKVDVKEVWKAATEDIEELKQELR
ncbi:MAG: DUF86 domain-containing protein [Patescibacteria group bacterium]